MVLREDNGEYPQDVFVLAGSAAEAVAIVGEDERRHIVSAHETCPISQLPTDRYRVQPVTPPNEHPTVPS